ncbi:MAG: glutamate ligase domain-containing protein [Alphaproteobacteria bacterium]
MVHNRPYFFCGIGGSGMLPLALLLRARGHDVSGSDRALDQGRMPEKFAFLRAQGVKLFPQDGSGITSRDFTVVASAAVEETVPDIAAARRCGAGLVTRAELLARLFNESKRSIGVAGTSGKTTTTGMAGWILHAAGRQPTIINGGVMKNFVSADVPFAGAVAGKSDLMVCEVDESDGSIAHYNPQVAVLTNVALDHKSLDELRVLFREFAARADLAVINLDNAETFAIARHLAEPITFAMSASGARLAARDLRPTAAGVAFRVSDGRTGEEAGVSLLVPGRHNVANALAAIGVALAMGVPLGEAAKSLGRFTGIRRRLETVGGKNGITVIDDFAHNPDKIAATLSTLHEQPGRLLVMFQPHGFGPLNKMRAEFVEALARGLAPEDVLVMPEPVYFGGTVERATTSGDIAEGVQKGGRNARAFQTRKECGEALLAGAEPGDRIVVMGARDDTLSDFAQELLRSVPARD